MAGRLTGGAILAAVLLGVLLYSQTRPIDPKVSGIVEADEVRVGSQIGGRVREVLVREGQSVKAGDPLVRLEEYDLGARRAEAVARLAARKAERDRLVEGFRPEEIAQAKARVQQLQATLQRLENGPLPEEIAAATAQLELATAQYKRAQQTFHRVSSLFSRNAGAVSREDVDRATEGLKVTEAAQKVRTQELALLKRGTRAEAVEEAKAKLAEATAAWELTKNGSRKEDIAAAESNVQAASAAVEAIDRQLQELVIRAPGPGVVEAIELQPGDLVGPAAPVLSLMATSRMWIRAYVPQVWLSRAVENREVQVRVDSLGDKELTGRISYVSRQAEFTPSNVQTEAERAKQVFRIRVVMDPGADPLRPGMAADVWLPAAGKQP